jgi:spore maturation protein CgeB
MLLKKTMVKVLFTAPLLLGSNSYELYRAFKKNKNCKVYVLDEKKRNSVYDNVSDSFFAKLMFKLKIPLDWAKLNKLLSLYDYSDINIIFIINGISIKPLTLKRIKIKNPRVKIISFSLDDMYAWHNRSLYYTLTLKYYDLVVTTKSYNVKELTDIGAKSVLFLYQGFSKYTHKPHNCLNQEMKKVLFIGFFEKDRYESILFLAENGIKVHIFGIGWDKVINTHKNLIIHNYLLIGKEYSREISCSKISLCFLRKVNRDLHTSRSLEIPACKGFMLAERTAEHEELFVDGSEAVFFDSNIDLLRKVVFYLDNEDIRVSIANKGYFRCLREDYSYNGMVDKILEHAGKLWNA